MRKALGREPGVESVDVDLPSHRVTVRFDAVGTSPERLMAALEDAGYEATPA